jgi:hypothetical protein
MGGEGSTVREKPCGYEEVPYGDRTSLVFETNELLTACGQAVAAVLPPTRRDGVLGERLQEIAAGPVTWSPALGRAYLSLLSGPSAGYAQSKVKSASEEGQTLPVAA